VLPVYGGQSYPIQLRSLERGAHVVVGTPGRVMDHMRRGSLRLDGLACLVLDEADEMLRMGFLEDVTWILEQTPAARQTALFSATLPGPVRRIAQSAMRDPVEVTIESQRATAELIRQRFWIVTGTHKLDALTRILETEEVDGMLVFVRTKTMTVELAERLEARGFACAPLSSDVPQNIRERTIERFKGGGLDVLVATDVAARGLDVDRISHVVNFDVPADIESYVHRIGRTGRAGRKGSAILFVAPRERHMLHAIERMIGRRIEPMTLPTAEQVSEQRVAKFKQQIADTIDGEEDLSAYAEIVAEFVEEHEVEPLDVAAALARMVQGDRPLRMEDTPPFERGGRFEEGRGGRERGPRPQWTGGEGVELFRVEVGLAHGARPANIVGAIANEAGIEGRRIGRIEIRDEHSTVELPTGMPDEVFQALTTARACGQELRISRIAGGGRSRGGPRGGPRGGRFGGGPRGGSGKRGPPRR
jgi:ATP-dependent RNA helicase DeaD